MIDLSFGDAGKGTVVDWLCQTRDVGAVVRFNGGAQAAHNVVTPEGRHHTFAQFAAGTLAGTRTTPVRTYLSRFMLVEPLALAAEAAHLARLGVPDPISLMRVDGDALLTTPYHAAANRAREVARGAARHGSCGIGVGQTVEWSLSHDAPRVKDAFSPATMTAKLAELRDAVVAEHAEFLEVDALPSVEDLTQTYAAFVDAVAVVDATFLRRLMAETTVVFEGAQGVLLDEWRGFHPHTTWSTTTGANIDTLLADAGRDPGEVARVGVLRTYTTRHGAGPMPTQDQGLAPVLPEPHNGVGRWQGEFRVGHFDAVAHRYAVEVAGHLDALALTHLDTAQRAADAGKPLRMVHAYDTEQGRITRLAPGELGDLEHQQRLTAALYAATPVPGDHVTDWPAEVGSVLGLPVALTSYGPTWRDKELHHVFGAGVAVGAVA